MTIETAECRAWARDVKAAWEITPLVEHQKGAPIQVGFALDLWARIPTEGPPVPGGCQRRRQRRHGRAGGEQHG